MAAAAIPVVALLAIAATELASVSADKGRLQDIVDAVALDGANQLALSANEGVVERAELSALKQMKAMGPRSSVEAEATIVENETAVRVAVVSRRPSFFGNMLPPGGFVTRAEATAMRMRTAPLCVLAHTDGPDTIRLDNTAELSAQKCLVHSNNEIEVVLGASLQATLVQSVGAARGKIEPEAQTGAKPITDPFASISIAFPNVGAAPKPKAAPKGKGKDDDEDDDDRPVAPAPTPKGCKPSPRLETKGPGTYRIGPGAYCTKVLVGLGQTLTLDRGNYHFMGGGLGLSQTASLKGADVTLFFDKDSTLEILDAARVNLEGADDGEYAGFLLVSARDNVNDFVIKADNVDNLLGTVYIPSAKLLVDGSAPVADKSEWTIVVAKELEVRGSSTLVINANYARSGVPVPPKYVEFFDRRQRQTRLMN